MTRLIALIFVFTCIFAPVKGQVNYVLNGSLEHYTTCPYSYCFVSSANYWNGIDSTYPTGAPGAACAPDLCHTCSSNGCCAVPNNASFHHYPRTGNAMADVTMYFHKDGPDIGPISYLQGHLYTHLTAGKSYCITFYTCFTGTNAVLPSGFAVDHIGAYVDDGSIDTNITPKCNVPIPSIIPQVYTTSIITDTVNWTKIQGSFIATGNERFITVGNFFDTLTTHYINYNPVGVPQQYDFAWYLVDDVSVIESTQTANAGRDTMIAHGDSVFIGTHDEGMPTTWYRFGSAVPIGHAGGMWVKPDTATHYVVMLDLCGHVTYDTVKVSIGRVGIGNVVMNAFDHLSVYPNPAANMVTIAHAAGAEVLLYDMIGKEVQRMNCLTDEEEISIANLPRGVYILHAYRNGEQAVRKLIKQ